MANLMGAEWAFSFLQEFWELGLAQWVCSSPCNPHCDGSDLGKRNHRWELGHQPSVSLLPKATVCSVK